MLGADGVPVGLLEELGGERGPSGRGAGGSVLAQDSWAAMLAASRLSVEEDMRDVPASGFVRVAQLAEIRRVTPSQMLCIQFSAQHSRGPHPPLRRFQLQGLRGQASSRKLESLHIQLVGAATLPARRQDGSVGRQVAV